MSDPAHAASVTGALLEGSPIGVEVENLSQRALGVFQDIFILVDDAVRLGLEAQDRSERLDRQIAELRVDIGALQERLAGNAVVEQAPDIEPDPEPETIEAIPSVVIGDTFQGTTVNKLSALSS